MHRKIAHTEMGKSDQGWLQSWFHFSFAEYYHPENIHFGALRVLNDDFIQPETGFGMHPHQNMEIITYVVNGALTHADNMGNRQVLHRGEIQYMSAGTGVIHSEYNDGSEPLRLLQIWIFPDKAGYPPQYGDFRFPWQDRVNHWLLLVSGQQGCAPVKIHQDVYIYAAWIDATENLVYDITKGRQGYLVQIEGSSCVNGISLESRDAFEIHQETVEITAQTPSHLLLFDMAEEQEEKK